MNGTEPLCDNNVEGQPSATVQRDVMFWTIEKDVAKH